MKRSIFEPEHEEFRELVRTFVTKECLPHSDEWERNGIVDRSAWLKAGEMGLPGLRVPEQYGGAGLSDPRSSRSTASAGSLCSYTTSCSRPTCST